MISIEGSSTNCIHPHAQIADDVEIGPYCVVGPDVILKKGVKLHEHVVIKGCTQIGEACEIFPFVSLGEAAQDKKSIQDGNGLIIGARNIIKEHTSIHTSSFPMAQTRIGSDCLIMGQAHIGHDCQIGNHVVITQSTVLGGDVCIGDFAQLGGKTGVHQGVHIGKHSFVGGGSILVQDLAPYCSAVGNHASLIGLNSVGLRRNGFSLEDRLLLKRAFKILFMSNLLLKDACAQLLDFNHPLCDELVNFAQKSKRGLLRLERQNRRRHDEPSDDDDNGI